MERKRAYLMANARHVPELVDLRGCYDEQEKVNVDNVSDYAVYRHTQRPRRDAMSRGDSSLRPRARTVSHDKAILAGARTEPRRCPVRLRVPPFGNRTFDRLKLSPWASTWECLLRYRL